MYILGGGREKDHAW